MITYEYCQALRCELSFASNKLPQGLHFWLCFPTVETPPSGISVWMIHTVPLIQKRFINVVTHNASQCELFEDLYSVWLPTFFKGFAAKWFSTCWRCPGDGVNLITRSALDKNSTTLAHKNAVIVWGFRGWRNLHTRGLVSFILNIFEDHKQTVDQQDAEALLCLIL